MTVLGPHSDLVQHSLLRLTRYLRPWADAEAALTSIAPPGAQLGGDPLRPYLAHAVAGRVSVIAVRRAGLPDPPLIAELLEGRYGLPAVDCRAVERARPHHGDRFYPDAEVVQVAMPRSPALVDRLARPTVLLVGLGDRDRYRGARLPLGVARLASWLRFTHAARVDVIDYSLRTEALGLVADALQRRPDVVGVGVNFGQWRLLADLAEVMEQSTGTSPVVVLGNILAAFSPDKAAALFTRAMAQRRVLVATGLGERPMEELCRSLNTPEHWQAIPGLRSPTRAGGRVGAAQPTRRRPGTALMGRVETAAPAESRPDGGRGTGLRPVGSAPTPSLVAPDDALVLDVAAEGGQVSLETSLGCQYGACTFCPRAHKGDGWVRSEDAACVAIVERFSRLRTPDDARVTLSLVDEEFFGAEGLTDPPPNHLSGARILTAMKSLGLRYEIYTRLEQLFDRRRSVQWNLSRAALLADAAPHMRRLFAGVESGSPSQLRRYGIGQTIGQTVDALRVASSLGVPLEFGFITFDPLLTPEELADNLQFLARTDVICAPRPGTPAQAAAKIGHYLNGADLAASGEPVYRHVAYMATELEVLANSRYADHLHRRHPHLMDGFDPAFCRFGARYAHDAIATIAGWCRVWTEGMFTPIYQARMAARSTAHGGAVDAEALIRRYRDATFALLVTLTGRHLPDLKLPEIQGPADISSDEITLLTAESVKVTGKPVTFDTSLLGRRRDR
ncbi:B12-binding domain-containing radical SAM protein [Actinomadura sp. LOL_016]|uniref:B12-binding domain-containing radical SAM protein n=1 Tax=unclassified Actinomadura TaxID=2626254 RepID=UPI003A803D70